MSAREGSRLSAGGLRTPPVFILGLMAALLLLALAVPAAQADQAEVVVIVGSTEIHFIEDLDVPMLEQGYSSSSASLQSVAFGHDDSGNDLWIAVGLERLLTSADGKTWQNQWSVVQDVFAAEDVLEKDHTKLFGVAYGNGLWVITTGDYETTGQCQIFCEIERWGAVFTSPDGSSWTKQLEGDWQFTDARWGATDSGDGTWLVRSHQTTKQGISTSGTVFRSDDGGVTWTGPGTVLPDFGPGSTIGQMVFGHNNDTGSPLWVSSGRTGKIFTSNNGDDWAPLTWPGCSGLRQGIGHDGINTWAAATCTDILISNGNGSWSEADTTSSWSFDRIAYHPGSHTWITSRGTQKFFMSTDGAATWQETAVQPGSTPRWLAARTDPPEPAVLANTLFSATPNIVPANGVDTATIALQLRDANNDRTPAHPWYDFEYEVELTTTIGAFSHVGPLTVSPTGDGTFRTTLSSIQKGDATITARIRDDPTSAWVNLAPIIVTFEPAPDPSQSTLTVERPLANETVPTKATLTVRDFEGQLFTDPGQPTVSITVSQGQGSLSAITWDGLAGHDADFTCDAGFFDTVELQGTVAGDPIAGPVTLECVENVPSLDLTTIAADDAQLDADGVDATTVRVTVYGELGDRLDQDEFVVCLTTDRGSFNSSDATDCPAGYTRTQFNATDDTYTLNISSTSGGLATITGSILPTMAVGQAPSEFLADFAEVDFLGQIGAATQLVITSSQADLASGAIRTLTAEVRDATGNLIATDNGRSVAFTKDGGSGTVTGLCGAASTSNGIATCTVTGNLAGPITIKASAAGLTAHETSFDVIPGVPDRLSFTSAITDLASGTSRILTVEVRDAAGNFVASDNGRSVAFTKDAGSGTVTGLCGAASTSNGIATCTVTGNLAGPITIKAAAGTLSADSTTFNVIAGTAAELVFTSSTGNLVNGFTRDLVVEVRDAGGNLVATDTGRTVEFAKVAGAGVVNDLCTGVDAVTTTNGIATCTVTGDTAGSITIEATATGLTAAQTLFEIVAAQPPTQYLVTASTNSPVAGAAVTITAQLAAADGSAVGGAGREVAWSKDVGSGSFSAATSLTNSFGVATVTLTTGTVAGTEYHVTATDSEFTGTSGTITTVHGPANHLFIAVQPAGGPSGQALATQPVIHVRDVNDNLVTNDSSTAVTATIQSGAGGALSGGQTVTATGGTIAFANLGLSGSVGESYTLRFADTAPGLVGFVISDAVGVTAGTPAQLTIMSSEADLASGAIRTLTAQVQDAAGNLVATDNGRSVTFTQISGAGTVTGLCGSATTIDGIATCDVTGHLVGPITIEASHGSLNPGSTAFDVVHGAAAGLVFVSATTDLLIDAVRTLEVEVRDAAGNLVVADSGRTVAFTQVDGAGAVTGLCNAATAAVTSAGMATCPVTGDSAGPITIQASTTGLTAAQSAFEVKAPPAGSIKVPADNQPPVITGIAVTPTAPSTVDDLEVTATVTDPDGDALTILYRWQLLGSDGIFQDVAGHEKTTLDSSVTSSGDVWRARVIASDGTDVTLVASDPVTIRNTAPTVSVSFADQASPIGSTIAAEGTVHDIDGDALNCTFTWTAGQTVVQTTKKACKGIVKDSLPAELTGGAGSLLVELLVTDGNLDRQATVTAQLRHASPDPVVPQEKVTPLDSGSPESRQLSGHGDDSGSFRGLEGVPTAALIAVAVLVVGAMVVATAIIIRLRPAAK